MTTTQTATKTEIVEVPVPEPLTKLTVNGCDHELHVEPNWTLAEVLRDKLGLTGTKISCDGGTCGACTVLLDDKPVFSCMTLAIDCEGKEITTIEGLATNGQLNPLQQAVFDYTGFQCGFCTPGMIMGAQALLEEKMYPNAEEIKEALAGHQCRCGCFYNFIDSVMHVGGS